jgi:hypothetical protein
MHPHSGTAAAVSDRRRRVRPRARRRARDARYTSIALRVTGPRQRGTELVGISMKAQAMALAVAGLCGLMQAAVACEIMGMPSW